MSELTCLGAVVARTHGACVQPWIEIRRGWILWSAVAVLLATNAFAQPITLQNHCFSVPRVYEDLATDPIWLNVCVPLGRECTRPGAPAVVPSSTIPDAVQSQTASVEFTHPPYQFDYFKVRVEYDDPTLGAVPLWETTSAAGSPEFPNPIRFGAPGLKAHTTHYFRVAYCSTSLAKCSCFSDRSAPVLTDYFYGPAPGEPFVRLVEDHFRRVNTDFVANGGDGIGPNTVWEEVQNNEGPVGRQRSVETERVDASHSQWTFYVGGRTASNVALDPWQYADIQLRRHDQSTTEEYNFDILLRGFESNNGTTRKGVSDQDRS